MRESLTARIKQQVKDPAVAAKLIPDYPVGCKRTCIIDGYWPVHTLPHRYFSELLSEFVALDLW